MRPGSMCLESISISSSLIESQQHNICPLCLFPMTENLAYLTTTSSTLENSIATPHRYHSLCLPSFLLPHFPYRLELPQLQCYI